jgi:hypothetical protein
MGENLEMLDELILWALGLLIAVTDVLTAIGFLVTFAVLLVAGTWVSLHSLLVRLRSLVATEEE